MPKLKDIVADLACARLNSRPFTAASPLWAQLLTGKPWDENGCIGYAQPQHSLNKVEIVTEKDLSVPVLPLYKERRGAVINVPILLPFENRAWLSDGSLPIQLPVMPASLAESEPFSTYQARAFDSLPYAAAMPKLSTPRCLETEENRLQCAAKLARDPGYQWLIVRLSIFDELAHFYGDAWLDEPQMWFREMLEEFCRRADDLIDEICAHATVYVLSCFSHCRCKSTANLNLILKQKEFLQLYQERSQSRTEGRRAEAIEAITGAQIRKDRLQSVAGQLVASKTLAASPVTGCIYVNEASVFADGCVSEAQLKPLIRDMAEYLKSETKRKFVGKTEFYVPSAHCAIKPRPECIVWIDDTLLTDALDPPSADSRAGSMHVPDGFVYGASISDDALQPSSLHLVGQIIGRSM
jgi:hypothetical protein